MQNPRFADVVLISINSPILCGIYENNTLIKSLEAQGKTSEALIEIFSEILSQYTLRRVFYAKGPGNFSAIKLSHIFLQTLKIARNIELFCADSFYFTNDDFIHAYGKIYFTKINDEIKTARLQNAQISHFSLPQRIQIEHFSQDCAPLYILSAV